jgi:GntR family transcriptional regulator
MVYSHLAIKCLKKGGFPLHLPIKLYPDRIEPLYFQIETQMKTMILHGTLKEGTLLPSIRELAHQCHCSVITVRRVYQDLEHEGLIRTKQGTGTFVAKVDQNARKKQQMKAVIEAFKQAIDEARHAGCSEEEMKAILETLLKQSKGGEDDHE